MKAAKHLKIGTILALSLILTLGFFASGQEKAREKINWNKPRSHSERLTADHYIFPEGWEEATQGVEKISFYNSGSIKWDIATKVNIERFTELTGIEVEAIPVSSNLEVTKSVSTLVSKDTSVEAPGLDMTGFELSSVAAPNWVDPVGVLYPPEVLELYQEEWQNILTWDGNFYAMPITYISHGDFYRPSFFENADVEIPDTYTEFLDAAKEVQNWLKKNKEGQDYSGTLIGAGGRTQLAGTFRTILYSNGEKMYANGEWRFDTKEAEEAFKWMVKAFREGVISSAALNYSLGGVADTFEAGKSASMISMQPSYLQYYKNQTDIGQDVALRGFKFDSEDPDSLIGANMVNANSITVNKYIDDNEKAAVMLLGDYLKSLQAQRNELIVEGNGSPMEYLWNNLEEQIKLVDWDFVNKQAEKLGLSPYEPVTIEEFRANRKGQKELNLGATHTAYPPSATEITDKFQTEFQKAAKGNISAEEALENIDEFAKEF